MTAVSGGYFEYPRAFTFAAATPAMVATGLIDASGEKYAVVFQAPKTGTIDLAGLLTSTVTQAPTNGLKVSLQDVDLSTGFPDGVADQFRTVAVGSIATNTWITTGLLTSDGTDTGSKRSVTRGDLLAIVVEFVSFSASDSLSIAFFGGGGTVNDGGFPLVALNTGAWTKPAAGGVPVLALRYSDSVYYPIYGAFPWSAFTTLSVNTGTTPDEIGLKFQMPWACKVGGLWVRRSFVAGRDVVCKLYDSDGSTVLATYTDDGDVGQANVRYITFSSEVSLLASTYYRATLLPSSASSLNFYYADVASAALLDTVPGGQVMHWTQRTDAGAWTDTTTRRPMMGLLITDITSGGGVSRSRVANAGGGLL